jgi:hypothetical protein
MTRLRLASWAALACLGLVAGCQSPNTCCDDNRGCGLFQGGLMSRLRQRCTRGETVVGAPLEGVPVSNGFPIGDATLGGGCPSCAGNGHALPSAPIMDVPPGATPIPPGPGLPPGATPAPPPGMLPAPAPVNGQMPLTPVPNGAGNGYAQPSPATPSSRAAAR